MKEYGKATKIYVILNFPSNRHSHQLLPKQLLPLVFHFFYTPNTASKQIKKQFTTNTWNTSSVFTHLNRPFAQFWSDSKLNQVYPQLNHYFIKDVRINGSNRYKVSYMKPFRMLLFTLFQKGAKQCFHACFSLACNYQSILIILHDPFLDKI